MERIARALEIARRQRIATEIAARTLTGRDRTDERVESAPDTLRMPEPSRPSEAHIAPAEYREPDAIDLGSAVAWVPDSAVLERHRVVTAHGHPAAAAYRMLRTQVLQRMRAERKQVLAVASTGPDEGKSVTALNLAYVLAADPKCTVVLLDLDLQRPAVGRYLGLEELPGIGSYLRGECDFIATTVRVLPYERLFVAASRPIGEGSAELLATDAVKKMFALLRATGPDTIILCDVPPLFAADDLLTLAPMLDCLLLVVGERQTDRDLLRRSRDFLPGVPLLGTVLNKSRDRAACDY
jgi:protein-tyrosine kinase